MMKLIFKNLLSAWPILLLLNAGGPLHANTSRWVAQDSSIIHVHGKSTLIPWILNASRLEATLGLSNLDGAKPLSIASLGASRISDLKVSIPVDGLKSTEGPAMDRNAWAALKFQEAPLVSFTFESGDFSRGAAHAGVRTLALKGLLDIAGKGKRVVIPAEAEIQDKKIILRGRTEISMGDWGITPPVISRIHVADKVVIDFNLVLVPSP